jgi:hypothetical protein
MTPQDNSEFYIFQNETITGPFTLAEIEVKRNASDMRSSDLVRLGKDGEWTAFNVMFEEKAVLAAAQPNSFSSTQPTTMVSHAMFMEWRRHRVLDWKMRPEDAAAICRSGIMPERYTNQWLGYSYGCGCLVPLLGVVAAFFVESSGGVAACLAVAVLSPLIWSRAATQSAIGLVVDHAAENPAFFEGLQMTGKIVVRRRQGSNP